MLNVVFVCFRGSVGPIKTGGGDRCLTKQTIRLMDKTFA